MEEKIFILAEDDMAGETVAIKTNAPNAVLNKMHRENTSLSDIDKEEYIWVNKLDEAGFTSEVVDSANGYRSTMYIKERYPDADVYYI